jgi:hypothetical protein
MMVQAEFEKTWIKRSRYISRHYPDIHLEELRKSTMIRGGQEKRENTTGDLNNKYRQRK